MLITETMQLQQRLSTPKMATTFRNISRRESFRVATIKANIQRGIDSGGHVDSIEVLTMAIAGDMAYSVGIYQATNAGHKVTGRNIVVCRKINGKWLIVAHTSVVPEQPKTK